jgi:hypothetical protein
MKPSSLKDFTIAAAETAAAMFAKQGNQLAPVYIALDRNGDYSIFPAPPGPKDFSMMITRAYLEFIGATRVIYVDEAWTLEEPIVGVAKERLDQIEREGVKNQPGHIECVLLVGEDATEPLVMFQRKINRDGDRVWLGPLVDISPDGAQGRMIGLLPVKGTKQ